MKKLGNFKAVYCSGMFIPDGAAATAMSLLFEKVFLPNSIELIRAFVRKYRIESNRQRSKDLSVTFLSEEGTEGDPFGDLTESQRRTAYQYINWGMRFSVHYSPLYGEVFETNLYDDGHPLKVTLIKRGKPGQLNKYRVSEQPLCLEEGNDHLFPRLLEDGYFPVVGDHHPGNPLLHSLDATAAKQLAVLLAMQSVKLVFPRTKRAHPEIILEARDRLSNHLPPFWSAMLKLSVELKQRVSQCASLDTLVKEGQDIVDTTVMPALIDLQSKLEKERKTWFHNILSTVQKGLRLMVGNPPLSQQQLLTNALILSSDVAMAAAGKMQTIEALKQEAGLTYLLELHRLTK